LYHEPGVGKNHAAPIHRVVNVDHRDH
jgi:hypothetical protein